MTTVRERVEAKLDAGLYLIPAHMRDGVKRYVLDGIPGGSFMTAVFANDLLEAFGRADSINAAMMQNWANFVYNDVPAECHGSYEIVHGWKGVEEPEPIDPFERECFEEAARRIHKSRELE